MCTAWRMWNDPKKKFPPENQKVLIAYRNSWDKLRRTTAEYVPPRTVLAENYLDWDEDIDHLIDTDERGQEWVIEGWWELPEEVEERLRISDPILAWIELPELPCDWRRK